MAQGSLSRSGGGMQGVGYRSGGHVMNVSGDPQGGGRGMPMNQGSGIDIAALKQTNPCHYCNKLGHWKLECQLNPNGMSFDNQIPNLIQCRWQ